MSAAASVDDHPAPPVAITETAVVAVVVLAAFTISATISLGLGLEVGLTKIQRDIVPRGTRRYIAGLSEKE